MSKVYQGHTTELYELFLKGTELQYRITPSSNWVNIYVYNGKPDDIYRVSHPDYQFRVKPKEVITKKYTYYDRIENTLKQKRDLNGMMPQFWWDTNVGLENEYLEWVFVNDKLKEVNVIKGNNATD